MKINECQVCFHHCRLRDGQYGMCRARKNENGRIICESYGRITSMSIDMIEKKPLRNFCPGSRILSVGSYGCNLSCPFCQNYKISMAGAEETTWREMKPQDLADLAKRYRSEGNIGIAFTYNEPLTGYEFVRDTARLIHEQGMLNVLVTNGTAGLPVLEELIMYIDAVNVDLKGFTDDYYRKLGGDLEMVKRFISRAAEECHVELTTLIVPGENDRPDDMEREAQWIASINPEIPLHVTRFFPRYRMMDREITDVKKVYRLRDAAAKYLRYVYGGVAK